MFGSIVLDLRCQVPLSDRQGPEFDLAARIRFRVPRDQAATVIRGQGDFPGHPDELLRVHQLDHNYGIGSDKARQSS